MEREEIYKRKVCSTENNDIQVSVSFAARRLEHVLLRAVCCLLMLLTESSVTITLNVHVLAHALGARAD